ncbi:MAG: protein phosphatase 2C domain-containing protein, partial [Desulfovibrionaceae bacterium]|nr:protein phosphatase 2C domain-containing protein [Desulfovibrionaceae bacterium]
TQENLEPIIALVLKSVLEANLAIKKEALSKERSPQLYATTLLLAMAKKVGKAWLIVSFNIGDGAIGVIYEDEFKEFKAQLLSFPDEGEFSGQTKFLTMPEILANEEELRRRVKITWVQEQDFTALFLMTDGVSDAKFESLVNLHDPKCWQKFWQNLTCEVNLRDSSKVKLELLEWLNFWAQGQHDDRTLAMLY